MSTNVTVQSAPTTAPAALPDPWATETVNLASFGLPGSIMLHSEPGKGKTRTGASIIKVPGFRRLAILDIDNGTESLLNDPELARALAEGRIKIIKIDKTQPDAFARFHQLFWHTIQNPGDFDAFMIDTLDVAQECAVAYLKQTVTNDAGTALDTRAAWGKIAEWTTSVLWALQNHPQLTGITLVHTKEDEEKKTGSSSLKPKFAGSAKDTAAGIPSLVAYLTKETGEDGLDHVIADIGGTGNAIAKQRYSSFLPNSIRDFDMPTVYRLIRGEAPADPTAATPEVAQAASSEIPPLPGAEAIGTIIPNPTTAPAAA